MTNLSEISLYSVVSSVPLPNGNTGFNPHLYAFILYNSIKPSILKCSNIISKNIKKTTALGKGVDRFFAMCQFENIQSQD